MLSWTDPPDAFVDALRANNLRRAWLVTPRDAHEMAASHPLLEPIARAVSHDRRDYHRHQGAFFEIGEESGHLLTAFLHWTHRGQGAGGVRCWYYDTLEGVIRDGLRLSRGMGHKNALAGLWWGGGKGVVARREGVDYADRDVRDRIYRDYGRFMSSLNGCYITAEDAGTTPPDMAVVFGRTRFTTCIPEGVGGSGNPSRLTATGVVVAMEAALEHLGLGPLAGKTVAMQGAGNVSQFMIGDLLARQVAHVIATDVEPRRLDEVRAAHPGAPLTLRLVDAADESIFAETADVLAPNALGGSLNPRTIAALRTRVVCGAANNQLEDPERDDDLLARQGIVYVPDFLANRMGIVNCSNEQYGRLEADPAILGHLERSTPHGIYQRTRQVLRGAEAAGTTPADEAVRLADDLSLEPHPIWGNRAQAIVDELVARGWAKTEHGM